MDEIIKLLMNMGKTKEEALEFVGKEMPTGGIDDVGSNIIKPITKKVAGDYPLIGSRITDPTQQGQFGRYFIQTLDPKDRYNLIRQSIDDQKENWQKTFEFIRTGGYKLSDLQKQNLNYNLGVLQRSKIVLTDITKGLESQKIDVEELYSSFVKNKRFLGNESTGLSSEGNEILEYINKTKEKIEDLTKTGKKQEEILSQQKKDNDARMKRLYNGRAYEKNDGNYRALGGYHLPKLHEAGIINLDPKIYEAIKKGQYHHGGADFFAPDPNRVLQYHYGTKIFDDLDDAINKAAMDGEVALKGPDGMIKFLKDNDYLPFKKDGPANALDYLNDVEKLERVKELDSATKTIKSGQSNFYKTPDQIMDRVMQNANDKFQYLDSLKRTHPGKFKLYQKDISEEPFFGVDIGQNDLFSDLSDLSFPKDKGDLLQFPKDNLGGTQTDPFSKDFDFKGEVDLQTELALAKEKEGIKAIAADPVAEAVAAIKALKPMDAMKEANKVAGKQDNYANLSDEQINKILEDTNDHIFERDLPTDDFDMAEGGRINFRSAGFISGRTKSSKSKSSSSKGPAGGASAGGNYGGNVNPNQTYAGKTQSQTPSNYGGTGPSTKTKTKPKNKITTKLKKANPGGKTPYQKYADHAKFTENMKNYGKLKNYHQLGGYDFMKRFDANPTLAKVLGYGYQGLSEGIKSLNPFDDYTFMDAMKRAKHEGDLNALGVEAYKNPDSAIAKQYDTLSPSGYGYDIMKVKK